MEWFKIGKGVCQSCILSPCLFNFYAEYIMRNVRPGEAQARIKITRRNTNNIRYVDDTTLMTESEEELMSLLMGMKEESKKVGLKLNIQRRSQDGGGVGRGERFLPHKFIKRAFKRRVNSTK